MAGATPASVSEGRQILTPYLTPYPATIVKPGDQETTGRQHRCADFEIGRALANPGERFQNPLGFDS